MLPFATFPSYVRVLCCGAVRQRRERGSCEPEYIQRSFGCSVQWGMFVEVDGDLSDGVITGTDVPVVQW